MGVRKIETRDIPAGRMQAAVWNQTPEFKQVEQMLRAPLRNWTALEVELCADSRGLSNSKKPFAGFSARLKKVLPPKGFHYQLFLRGGKLYLLSTGLPKVRK